MHLWWRLPRRRLRQVRAFLIPLFPTASAKTQVDRPAKDPKSKSVETPTSPPSRLRRRNETESAFSSLAIEVLYSGVGELRYVFGILSVVLIASILGCLSDISRPETVPALIKYLPSTAGPLHASEPALPAPRNGDELPTGLGGMSTIDPPTPVQNPVDSKFERAELVRDLQRGLTQLGCYAGPLNGRWDVVTRRAMSGFIAQANARLPLDGPELAMLELIKAQQGRCKADSCGATRRSCAPNSKLTEVASPVASSLAEPGLVGQMGLGGPVPEGSRSPKMRPKRRYPKEFAEDHKLFIHPLGQF